MLVLTVLTGCGLQARIDRDESQDPLAARGNTTIVSPAAPTTDPSEPGVVSSPNDEATPSAGSSNVMLPSVLEPNEFSLVPASPEIEALLLKTRIDVMPSSITPMGPAFERLSTPTTAAQKATLADYNNFLLPVFPQLTPLPTDYFAAYSGKLKTLPIEKPFLLNPNANRPNWWHTGQHQAIRALVAADPTLPARLITDVSPNKFSVHLYDPQGKPVDVAVDNRFLYDPNLLSMGRHEWPGYYEYLNPDAEPWVLLLMKALDTYARQFPESPLVRKNDGGLQAVPLMPVMIGKAPQSYCYPMQGLTPQAIDVAIRRGLVRKEAVFFSQGNIQYNSSRFVTQPDGSYKLENYVYTGNKWDAADPKYRTPESYLQMVRLPTAPSNAR